MGYQLKEVYNSVDELSTRDRAISVIYGRTPDATGGQIVPVSVDASGNLLIGSPLVLTTDDIDIGDVVTKGITDPAVGGASPTAGEARIGLRRIVDDPLFGGVGPFPDFTDVLDAGGLHAQYVEDPRMQFDTEGKLKVDTSVNIDNIDIGDVNIKGKVHVPTPGCSLSGTSAATSIAGGATSIFTISVDGAPGIIVGDGLDAFLAPDPADVISAAGDGWAVAAELERAIRYATGLDVEVIYNPAGPDQYKICSPTTGSSSSVVITNTAADIIALKLGVANLGTETAGKPGGIVEEQIAALPNTDGSYALSVQDSRQNYLNGAIKVTTQGSGTVFPTEVIEINAANGYDSPSFGTSVSGINAATSSAGTETFNLSLNGSAPALIGPLAVSGSGAAVAADMEAKIQAVFGAIATVSFNPAGPDQYTITSASFGIGSSVIVTGAAGGFAAFNLGVANGGTETAGANDFEDTGNVFDVTGFDKKSFVLRNSGSNQIHVRAFASVDGGIDYDIPILSPSNLNPGGVIWIDEERTFTHFKWAVEHGLGGDSQVTIKGYAA